jgi:hypothetical protein
MDSVYEKNYLQVEPTPPESSVVGYPTRGNPVAGVPATTPGEWWYHMITSEIRNAIIALGQTPDATTVNQLAAGLQSFVQTATTESPGIVKPDGTTIAVASDGTISSIVDPLPTGGNPGDVLTRSDDGGTMWSIVVPVGTFIFTMSQTVPNGWLHCNGAEISRTAYADLFASIGTIGGAGDGSTTFNVPDMRGYFPRGYGGNSAGFGVAQGDAIRNIVGNISSLGALDMFTTPSGAFRNAVRSGTYGGYTGAYGDQDQSQFSGLEINSSLVVPTAVENRSLNKAWLPIVKY